MKNLIKLSLVTALLFAYFTCRSMNLIPTSYQSARPIPGIIRFAYPNLTSIQTQVGIYTHTPRRYRPSALNSFIQAMITKNIGTHLYLSTNMLIPHSTNKRPAIDMHGTILFGYTHSFLQTKKLDFINSSIASGVALMPESNKNRLGLPLCAQIEWGLFDWMNIGIQEHIFFEYGKNLAIQQNSLLYLYADHPLQLIEARIGISQTKQFSSLPLSNWNMFTVHGELSCNLATKLTPHLPTLTVFCDYALGSTAAARAQSRLGCSLSCSF